MAKRKKKQSNLSKINAFFGGIFLCCLTALLIISFLSFNPHDAGPDVANSFAIKNLLGPFGSYFSAGVLTWLGISLPVLLFIPFIWSFELIKYKKMLFPYGRIFSFLFTIFFFAITVSLCQSQVRGFKLGGNIGTFFASKFLSLANKFIEFGYNNFILILIFAFLTLISFNFACGINFKNWYNWGKKIAILVYKSGHFCYSNLSKLFTVKSFKPHTHHKSEPTITEKKHKAPSLTKSAPKAKAKPEAKDGYLFPSVNLLSSVKDKSAQHMSSKELEEIAAKLEAVLQEFGVFGKIVQIRPGPVVTLYELEPAPGTKTARVIGLSEDIARSMSAVSVRIAVVPGSNTIGIELPNTTREIVYLRDLVDCPEFNSAKAPLTISLGKDIGGKNTYADLAKMPHLLVAGTTGSGKSVGVNSMILSLLYRMRPEECKLIMIDPKMLEFTMYNGIPHLLTPVITDPAKAVIGLKWAVKEMEDRYRSMAQLNVRNINGYNQRLEELKKSGEKISRTVQTGFDMETGKPIYEKQELDLTPMPYIVIVVDEMADLMLVAGKEVEAAIQRLAQMARAAGIHLIMSTQRPSVDVITGTIKANFPTRISYQVTSKIDSRTILGEQGAEQLLGMGDMLYMPAGQRPRRVHAPFVKDSEVEKIVEFLKNQRQPEYVEAVTEGELNDAKLSGASSKAVFDNTDFAAGSDDDLYNQAVEIVQTDKKASISYIQRRLRIGYNRAATIVDKLEENGIVSAPDHSGRREVL